MSGLLFGITRFDLLSFVLAGGLLGAVGTLSAWIPARRAVAVDPTEALRSD